MLFAALLLQRRHPLPGAVCSSPDSARKEREPGADAPASEFRLDHVRLTATKRPPKRAAFVKEKLNRRNLLAAANHQQCGTQSSQGDAGRLRHGGDVNLTERANIGSPNIDADGFKAELHVTRRIVDGGVADVEYARGQRDGRGDGTGIIR